MPNNNRLLRSKRLRALLWYTAGGKCQRCGCELPNEFAADHVVPYSVSKRTNFHEMQVLCHKCNREKGAMSLRKHQLEMLQICDQIKAGISDVRTIIASVTPGGGKSLLPVIAAARLIPIIADAICWIAPRDALRKQAEEVFGGGKYRKFLNHNHQIRAATNDHNPCRGLSGYVTTYQALNADRGTRINAQEFATKRYILFLDEIHHAELDKATHEAIRELVNAAKVVIFASGTFERNNGRPIAFLPYKQVEGGFTLDFENLNDPKTHVIRYTRRDALVEKAIIPLHFQFVDCRAEWVDREGESRTMDSLAEAGEDTGEGLYTALNTEYAFELLKRCLDDWQAHRQLNGRARMLVVAANIASAKRYLKWLQNMNMNVVVGIATSADTKDAKKAIERFKTHGRDAVDILVTVAMAYEGLDVPAVTHIACLTHIRSTPWIEQMVTRAARVDGNGSLAYEHQFGFIYAPDDQLFQECIQSIKAEQEPFLREQQEQRRESGNNGNGQNELRPPVNGIVPLASAATRERASGINGEIIDYEETQRIMTAMQKAGISGFSPIQGKQFLALYESYQPIGDTTSEFNTLTPSQMESQLRQWIENHNRSYEGRNKLQHGTINKEIKTRFGKSRDDMTVEELKRVWGWVQTNYPILPSA
jgi:superfamily II DNA or RNA helicase